MTDLSYGRETARTSIPVPGLAPVVRVLAAIGELIRDVRWAFAAGLKMQANYERLSAMSDQELARLGLTRADIPRAVTAPLKLL